MKCAFQGTFRNGQKTGNGRYTCNNGESFEGTYSNNPANGPGKQSIPTERFSKENLKPVTPFKNRSSMQKKSRLMVSNVVLFLLTNSINYIEFH
ncbi:MULTISPECIES: MORN repeat protein [Leptospira]|uniref:MORN repeat protein n=1 Tax=Leptospira borgpetersenii str. 200701203 TaxID=1193007 RepID=M3HSM5_LEPBO|nr:MORN repeat protein [Leptospira borgpetersenii]EMG00620.1 MORN repeat protein [Leptospira borgpetersenii str. 200701203]EMK10664.1 MORN repeat protein [Leptospira sp. serovar Kenya str. Sh9]